MTLAIKVELYLKPKLSMFYGVESVGMGKLASQASDITGIKGELYLKPNQLVLFY